MKSIPIQSDKKILNISNIPNQNNQISGKWALIKTITKKNNKNLMIFDKNHFLTDDYFTLLMKEHSQRNISFDLDYNQDFLFEVVKYLELMLNQDLQSNIKVFKNLTLILRIQNFMKNEKNLSQIINFIQKGSIHKKTIGNLKKSFNQIQIFESPNSLKEYFKSVSKFTLLTFNNVCRFWKIYKLF